VTCFSHRALAVALVLLGSVPAWAQRAAGPFAGVLGSTGDLETGQTLDLRGSAHGAWDQQPSATEDLLGDDRFIAGGLAGGASGGLTHVFRAPRGQWQSSVDSAMRVYGTDSDLIASTFSGLTGANTKLGTRVSLSGSGGFSYSPYYEFAPGLDSRLSHAGAFGGGFGLATAAERNISTNATAGLGVQFSRRDTFTVGVNTRRDRFLDQEDSSVGSWGGNASFSHQLTRSLGVHAGFGREEVTYEFEDRAPVSSDSIDVGVDYGDTLTFSRRTALSFGTSTSAIRWEGDTHYRVNGTVTLTRAFGRTGSGSLTFERGNEFRAGFREPLLTDRVTGGLSDQIGRRARWSAQAAYMRGTVGFDSTDSSRFNSVNAGGEVTMALTRHLALYTDYMYYRYEVPAGSTVFNFLPTFSRQSITAGLTLWVPLISERTARDTR
jgi:hypothetical protein